MQFMHLNVGKLPNVIDCFDNTFRTNAYHSSLKTQKDHGIGHGKSWNFKTQTSMNLDTPILGNSSIVYN